MIQAEFEGSDRLMPLRRPALWIPGMCNLASFSMRAVVLCLVFSLNAARASADAQRFQFGSTVFFDDAEMFLAENGADWSYAYARGTPASKALEVCQQKLRADGMQSEDYISGCFFRSKTNPYFSGMYLYAKACVLHRVLLVFKDNQDQGEVYQRLNKRLGQPSRRGQYNEEAFVHNLVEWNKDAYRVVLDYGGVNKSEPAFLIYEKLPEFPRGFNPPMVNLQFLGDVR